MNRFTPLGLALVLMMAIIGAFATDPITRFDTALKRAGIPIYGVSGSGPNCRIDFAPDATAAQRQEALRLRETFDWSPNALSVEEEKRRQAADALTAGLANETLTLKELRLLLQEAIDTGAIRLER